MCDCQSYNRPEVTGSTPEVVLDPRVYFPDATKTVCVDACIAIFIRSLWAGGIRTVGCCCGHGGLFQRHVHLADAEDEIEATWHLSRADPTHNWEVYLPAPAA